MKKMHHAITGTIILTLLLTVFPFTAVTAQAAVPNSEDVLVYGSGFSGVTVDASTPVITSQPADVTAEINRFARPEVTAAVPRGTLTYQWYWAPNNSNTGGIALVGANNNYVSMTGTSVGTLYLYCVVTNTDPSATGAQTASVTSEVVALTFIDSGLTDVEEPDFTHPADLTVGQGEPATLSVTASPTNGVLSFQWYEAPERISYNGSPIPGATNAFYSAPTDTVGTKYYFCVVTNTDPSATGIQTVSVASYAAAVTVNGE